MTVDPVPTGLRRVAEPLRWGAAIVLAGVAVLRCLTQQIPQAVFDLDPTLALRPQPGLTPGWSLLVDAVALLAAAAGLAGERLSGRRLWAWAISLAWLPLPVLVLHGEARLEHAWRGAAWLASVAGAVTAAHLVRDRAIRRTVVAMLLGALAALVVRGAVQVLVEHPETVRHYRATKAQLLAERGWAPDSPAARIYEERIEQREAIGWFGLANAFSTLMAAGAVAVGGLAATAWHRRASLAGMGAISGWAGVAALLAVGCAALLLVNGGKGAVGAAILGGTVFLGGAWGGGRGETARTWADRAAPWMAPLLAMAAAAAVAVRGVALPEGWAAERSLLFRWHYLVDAGRALAGRIWTGVGPDGFQEAMVAVRSPRHPEEVASAHNVFADWLVSLGPLGAAWCALFLWLLARAGVTAADVRGQGDAERSEHGEADGAIPRRGLTAVFVLALVALAAIVVESATLDPLLLATRLLGAGASVLAAVALLRLLGSLDRLAAAAWALFGAVCVVAVHAQIDMTLWLAGSAPWAILLVAACAPLRASPAAVAPGPAWRRTLSDVAAAGGAGLSVAAAALLVVLAWPVLRQERLMAFAARPLEAVGEARVVAGASGPRSAEAIERLGEALARAEVPHDVAEGLLRQLASPEAHQRELGQAALEAALREAEVRARLRAIERLLKAWNVRESNAVPLLAVVDQRLRLASASPPPERAEHLRQAYLALRYLTAEVEDSLRIRRRAAETFDAMARVAEQTEASPRARAGAWRRAFDAWEEVTKRDPCSVAALRRLAYAAERAGRAESAAAALRRALEVDAELVLDPRKRLSPEERRELETRLRALSAGDDAETSERTPADARSAPASDERPPRRPDPPRQERPSNGARAPSARAGARPGRR